MGQFEHCETLLGSVYFERTSAANYARLFGLVVVLLVNFFKKRQLLQPNYNGNKSLLLPIYYQYFVILLLLQLILTLIAENVHNDNGNYVLLSTKVSVYEFFSDGICFFLMQHGAGQYALKRAIVFSSLWASVIFVFFMFIFFYDDKNVQLAFYIYITFTVIVILLYSQFIILPIEILYRRPGTKYYALYKIVYNILFLMLVSCILQEIEFCYCLLYGFRIFIFFITPLVLYKLLLEDSNYWQGLGEQLGNPLAGAFDAFEMSTTSELTKIEDTSYTRLPFIHFGLIDISQTSGYVAGGQSRVYFGKYKNEKVAVKFLFAIELNPDVVKQFYNEVRVLYSMQHVNIVRCYGLSVMPPAVCVILEHCSNGSLFDYLHNLIQDESVRLSVADIKEESLKNPLVNEMVRVSVSSSRPGSSNWSNQGVQNHMSETAEDGKSVTSELTMDSSLHNKDVDDLEDGKKDNDPSDNDNKQAQHRNTISTQLSKSNKLQNPNNKRIRSTPSLNADINPTKSTTDLRAVNNSIDSTSSSNISQRVDTRGPSINSNTSHIFQKKPKQNPAAHNPVVPSSSVDDANSQRDSFISRGSFIHSTVNTILHLGHLSTDFAKKKRPISLIEKFEMIKGAASGIAFLHSMGYMHCDIKSPNFLVNHENIVKLADLGEAREISEVRKYLPNPARNWAPPEILNPDVSERYYGPASDVYGLAMVIAEILTQEIPMDEESRGCTPNEWYNVIAVLNCRPEVPQNLPAQFNRILNCAWDNEPLRRPSAEMLAEHADYVLQFLKNEKSEFTVV